MKVQTLQGHSNPIYTVASSTDNHFYTAGNDKGIVEWDLNSKTHIRVFKQIQHTVYALLHIPKLNLLVAGCNNGSLLFFDSVSTNLVQTINVNSAIFHLAFVEHKNELLVSTDIGLIMVMNPMHQTIVHQFRSGNQKVRSFAFHQKLNLLATVSNDEQIRIYALDDYSLLHQFKGHESGVGSVTFSQDGRFLLSGGRDAHLKVWNVVDWSLAYNFPAHLFAIYQIAYHPYLPYFSTASRDKSIKIWRSEDFSLFKNLSIDKSREGHLLSVNDICWTTDGKNLISVSDDKCVKVWDFEEIG